MAFPQDLDPSFPGYWDREKLAFTLWVSQLITHANGGVDLTELGLLAKLFPDDKLLAYGIIDADGELTPLFERAREDAIKKLHTNLTLDEKLELVTCFHQICMADDELVQAELLVLREAGEALGLTVSQLGAHLRTLKG